jgi:hypothetical protein
MTPALERQLKVDFPTIYRDDHVVMFEHDDGWEPLVRDLSATLEGYALAQIAPATSLEDVVVAVQVKQEVRWPLVLHRRPTD